MKKFWDKVDMKGPDECWPWLGARTGGRNRDYGAVRLSNPRRVAYAHRVAFELTNGHSPKVARHTCDNPLCCNPAHIIDGTQADNVRDKVDRGRQLKGEEVGNSKLTENQVIEIRRLLKIEAHECIAKKFGVSRGLITCINTNKAWRHT